MTSPVNSALDETGPTDLAGFNPYENCDGYKYDPVLAEAPVRFFKKCIRHVDGEKAGQPFELEEWQANICRALFGWVREDTGTRRFREAIIFVPRKNGKSTLVAGLSLFMLLCDGERRAQCYCAAGDKEQAGLVYGIAADMAVQHPAIYKNTRVYKTQKRITHKNRFLRAVAANDGAIHGTKPHFVCGDEIHVWKNFALYEAFHTGTGASERSLECYISTAGHDKESFGFHMRERARKVRDGLSTDQKLLPVLYEPDEGDDWKDEKTWAKVNPNLGVTVSLEFLRQEFKRAMEEPSYQNSFRRLYVNEWTSQSVRWLSMEAWDACPATTEVIEPGSTVYEGLDLSSTTDFTALMMVAPQGDGTYRCRGRYWLPEKRAEFLEKKHGIDIGEWIRGGWLTLCPDATIEYQDYCEWQIIQDVKDYDVQAIAYDPHMAHGTHLRLGAEMGFPMEAMPQTPKHMTWPAKLLQKKVLDGKVDHGGDPVLRWMADNADVHELPSGDLRIIKSEGRTRRHVDGIVALAMAIGMAELNDGFGSIYEERGAGVI